MSEEKTILVEQVQEITEQQQQAPQLGQIQVNVDYLHTTRVHTVVPYMEVC